MRLAWHIIRKDLLRLRWILLLWAIMLATGLGLAAIQGRLDADTYFPFHLAAKATLAGFTPLIAFGLVMGLLHDDPVADVDAFWITRPVSGGELLAAKTLAWVLLGLLPVAVTLPFWMSYDCSWGQIIRGTGQTLGLHFLLGALALPFAVISANGSRFVMNVLVGAGGLLLLSLLSRVGSPGNDQPANPELVHSRTWLVAGLWLVAAITVTLIQFLRRRTRQSLVVLATAVILGFGVAKWWPWALGNAAGEPAQVASAIVAEVPLHEDEGSARNGTRLGIQFVYLSGNGELRVSFSEATPHLSGDFLDLLPGATSRPEVPGYYFILNRTDGRAFAVQPSQQGSSLDAATLYFTHASFATRPAQSLRENPPPDLTAWLKNAVLVKAVASDPQAFQILMVAQAREFHAGPSGSGANP